MAQRPTRQQRRICRRYGAKPWRIDPHLKAGVALNARTDALPLNGLRHPPDGLSSGWFLWAGEEPSTDPDFFLAVHIEHLAEWGCPEAVPYLALPPGWRFLVAPGHEDVWYDPSLLDV